MATIQGIYVALFGRPADPLGLDYFNSITDGGKNLSQINSLAGQPEYLDRFEGQNNVQIVTSIYQELFGRNPDAAGLAFFTAQLNSGAQNINTIAINILDGARGEDAALVAAKIAAADQFTAAVRADPDALAAYQGQSGISAGQAFLDQVNSPDVKFTDAQVADQVSDIGNGIPSGGDGLLFNLTAGVDTFAPNTNVVANQTTSGDDRFEAAAGTLNTGDLIDGGRGRDVLNAAVGASVAPTVRNVEVLNLSAAIAASVFDAANVSAAEQINFTGVAAAGNDLTINNVTLGQDIGYSAASAGSNLTVNFLAATGAADAASVSLSGANGILTLNGIETVNLDASAASTVTLGATTATVVNITGSATTLNYAATVAATIASGDGADTINLTGATAAQTVVSGAGNDTIAIDGNFAHTLTGGAGNDTFVITTDGVAGLTAANIASASALSAAAIEITDFSASDLLQLNLDAGVVSTLTGTELSNVAGQTDLLLATNAALGFAGANANEQAVEFQYGGNTYVVVDEDGSGTLSANDALVQLTGLSDLGASQLQLV
ncbi:DUF4214 domain-containing protein [Tianweitania populi]|uniref:DUF4214 domain-containing protein n=1 Tax=Tianweitania populi TaxID=1607949 RepID=A0A8J3DPP2_9HYPH|nr:DUF4214 domain-containing protein [Tianweitania populi]GHD12794.1 hypothetical protein GCM10016234_17600 [Tianweitania populi]